MKKLTLLLLLLAVSNGFSQTRESLKARTEKMFAATNAFDLKGVMDLTYNKIFETVDRKTLEEAMAGVFNNEYMSIDFVNPKATFDYSDIKEIEGKKFSVIKYRNAMKMTLKQKPDPATAQGILEGLKSSGKYSSVTFDEASGSFLIEGDAVLIAVADASTKNEWEFVNYDNEEIFKLVFNDNIKKGLGL